MVSWVDGQPDERLAISDRALAYGDGLFETMRVERGRPCLFERHMARLRDGCGRLRIPLDDALLRSEVLAYCAQFERGVAKLIVTRGDGLRGYAPPTPSIARRILQSAPLPAYPAVHGESGVELFPCRTRLAEQPLLAGLKHLNRLEQVLARGEWQDAAFAEGLMCDTSGRVIEGVFSNLFLVLDGRLLTPSLQRCGVAGVMRAEIIERAAAAGMLVEQRDISVEELQRAEEIFLCNSLYGIWPVRRLRQRIWPVGGVTRKLQALLSEHPGNS
ncbi:aminodeoxychorismate lyase [Stutzerimonas kirkiae]|uniref:aminodeoxychorismate lyase n=1 Tax=Stutzerimonas kirkiae TaxID=2211392 RepID=UPI001038387E|nr:aminodeoxychorismate lyase [Stutzerimonas kirkiae]TBV12102.1 aminodeoxychorismate lyase [Stutzerimonas kirkiae]TBV15064.1 aminodeoxychorismate lyase [Stutzerimonas kirkiae]